MPHHDADVARDASLGLFFALGSRFLVRYAGSIRRGCHLVRDADLVVASDSPEEIAEVCSQFGEIVFAKDYKVALKIKEIDCDVWISPVASFAHVEWHRIGSREHVIAVRQRMRSIGLHMSPYGWKNAQGDIVSLGTQAYILMGMPVPPPEDRDGDWVRRQIAGGGSV